MENRSEFFDPVCRSLVAAGESSGHLPAMLDRLALMARKQLHVRSAVIGAMVYPALLMTVAVSVLALLLLFVIPRFAGLFESLEVPLPPTTEVLIRMSGALQSYWWAGLILLVGSVAGLKFWLASAGGRRAIDTLVLHLPQFGRVVRSFATARICRLLGVLLEGRVPVLEALELAQRSAGNVHYSALMAQARDAVARGEPISSVFRDTDLVSPAVYEAIHSGEQSGQVGTLLLNIADFLDDENEVIIRSLTSILEPVILVVMGLLVGVVAMSLFMPLFDLTGMTGGGGG
jgi:type II secretory pathway component PulF